MSKMVIHLLLKPIPLRTKREHVWVMQVKIYSHFPFTHETLLTQTLPENIIFII